MRVFDHLRYSLNKGVALVAAAIATLVLAGAVAVYFELSASSSRLAGAQKKQITLDSFALGVLNICPSVVDSVRGEGDFVTRSILDAIQVDGSIDLDVVNYAELSAEIKAMNNWSDYSGSMFTPDLVARGYGFTGLLDVDLILPAEVKTDGSGGSGGGLVGRNIRQGEENAYSGIGGTGGSAASSLNLGERFDSYRCFAWAQDENGRSVVYYGLLER